MPRLLRTASAFALFAAVLVVISACDNEDSPAMQMYSEQDAGLALNANGASHFARLALDCIHKEYPNKLNQVLPSEEFLQPPRELHPSFYGCFDWHSSVHGHWMLVKLLKEFPELAERSEIEAGLRQSISAENIEGEVNYFEHESGSWERTYGWAWLLQLALELDSWNDPLGAELSANLAPLTALIRDKYVDFLPRQVYPVRTGVHPNTAFGISFALDYARHASEEPLASVLIEAATRYYVDDKRCPIDWEPSGEDFLSPCLEEAAVMARVLAAEDFEDWFEKFLPRLDDDDALVPVDVSDRSDPKIVHLDGLNLSRAWNLYILANRIDSDRMQKRFRAWAGEHLEASLPFVASEHYEGSHWLGSFAVYALTRNR